jgi:hypothetical protein
MTADFTIVRDSNYGDGTLAATLTLTGSVPSWMREKRLGRVDSHGRRVYAGPLLAENGRLPREITLSATEDWSVEGGQVLLFLTRDEATALRDWLSEWLMSET